MHKQLSFIKLRRVGIRVDRVGMMFENEAVVADKIADDLGVLFEDRQKRRGKNDMLHGIFFCVRKRKTQRTERFPGTGRQIHTVDALGLFGKRFALVRNGASCPVDGCMIRKFR